MDSWAVGGKKETQGIVMGRWGTLGTDGSGREGGKRQLDGAMMAWRGQEMVVAKSVDGSGSDDGGVMAVERS